MNKRGMLASVLAMVLPAVAAAADREIAVPPRYPPEMVPAPTKPLPVVTVEPVDVTEADGRRRIVTLARGVSYDDVPKPSETVANHAYVSWSGWPLGTEAWWDAESLGASGRRDGRRLVDRLERWSPTDLFVNEFWATREGFMWDGSSRGIGASSTPDWDLIPRRAGELVFWRVYRARITISEAAGPTPRPIAGPRPGAGLINADGFVRPEGAPCLVVEWCERSSPATTTAATGRPASGRVRLTREVRHASAPDGVLVTAFGTATLDPRDGIADEQLDYRRVLDRVLLPVKFDVPEKAADASR